MGKTKLIIFDFDGVIVDTTPIIKSYYDLIIQKYEKKYMLDMDHFKKIAEAEWWLTLERIGFRKDEMDMLHEEFKLYMAEFRDQIKLIKGMPEVINKLWKNYKLAIVSNEGMERIEDTLNMHNLLYKFDFVVDNSFGFKPEPTQINVCLNKLQIKPEETIMIGDMDGDIIASKRAGLKKSIAVTFGMHHKERLIGADHIVNRPEEILKLVE